MLALSLLCKQYIHFYHMIKIIAASFSTFLIFNSSGKNSKSFWASFKF